MIKIIVVDDDKKMNSIMVKYLSDSGFSVQGCLCAQEAFERMCNNHFDLVISDIMMPNIDGFGFAESVRKIDSSIPIIFVSARDDLASKAKGFRLGIDDYMTKPIELSELEMRVRALLRRANIYKSNRIEAGNLVLDSETRTAFVNDDEIELTTREFNILFKMLSYPQRAFSRAQLMDEFWDFESPSGLRAVDIYITKLREKLSDCNSIEIKTIRGIGYKVVLL